MANAVLSPLPSRLNSAHCSEHPAGLDTSRICQGTRFYRSGHWWEVDQFPNHQDQLFYKCRPACEVETLYFTKDEILASIDTEQNRFNHRISASVSRGSGRIEKTTKASSANQNGVANLPVRDESLRSNYSESIKLLAIGSKQSVKSVIQTLHTLHYARCDDWSPIQPGKRKGEFLSILIQKKPFLTVV